MSLYPFHALLGRMKYITRWALMRCMRQESLSEHTADTALLAHALCLIARNITHTGADIRPDTVAAAALYHDAPEILTGDMPTPVKYKNEALRTAYKAVERESALAMADLLPPELHEIEGSYLTGSVLNDAERKLLKAADRLGPDQVHGGGGKRQPRVHRRSRPAKSRSGRHAQPRSRLFH